MSRWKSTCMAGDNYKTLTIAGAIGYTHWILFMEDIVTYKFTYLNSLDMRTLEQPTAMFQVEAYFFKKEDETAADIALADMLLCPFVITVPELETSLANYQGTQMTWQHSQRTT
ncbi:hypothetical protein C5167_044141 [Papaver somniferum]|uniref:Uncharacterized protein n=1 Tax=Papaver somniferum TaxID=3469 RepID=A0A4Y7L7T4_PAPSO|nr:hypothetical protein C5167_044141 [Papaver somniferum]